MNDEPMVAWAYSGRVCVSPADEDGEHEGGEDGILATFGDSRDRSSWEEAQLYVGARAMLCALKQLARSGHTENERGIALRGLSTAMADVMPEEVS